MPDTSGGVGTLAVSVDAVVTPTNLIPGLPTAPGIGNWLFCYTACTSPTATVATPAGWQSVANVAGANGRMVLFAKKVVGDEGAPTVTWSGLVTGTSGSPCTARIVNMGTGFGELAGTLLIDVLGAVADQAASTTVMAGGTGITPLVNNAILFAMGVRRDEAAASLADAGTGVTWNGVFGDQTTSGADALTAMSWAVKSPADVVATHTWVLTGGTSVASSGVMLSLVPTVDVVPTLVYTSSRVRNRASYGS